MKVGIIGLGQMGRAIAERLVSQGNELVVWNRTASKAEGLLADMVVMPGAVTSDTDIVILCLSDSAAVREVLTRDGGLLEGGLEGRILVDMTTNDPLAVEAHYNMVSRVGGDYLEAPVIGSIGPASQGALTVLVSGHRGAFDRVEPLLRQLGSSIHYMGKPGLASRMKVVNNMVLGTLMTSLAEAVGLGEAAGIERETILGVLADGAGASALLRAKGEKLSTDEFSPHFKATHMLKDLRLSQLLAEKLDVPTPTGEAAESLYEVVLEEGDGQKDFSVVLHVIKEFGRPEEEYEEEAGEEEAPDAPVASPTPAPTVLPATQMPSQPPMAPAAHPLMTSDSEDEPDRPPKVLPAHPRKAPPGDE